MVAVVRLVQSLKALLLMIVTLLGIVMLARLLQLRNALLPMLVTLEVAVKVTLARLLQSKNA
jgi:hypothetical protein